MKKLTALLVSLAVVILVAYYVMGFIVESTLNKQLNSVPKNPVFSVLLDKYKRGLFSSEATLAITMHIPEQVKTDVNGETKTEKPIDMDLNFPLIINHGPFIFTDYGIRFGMGQVTTLPQTHFSALVSYCNNTLFRYTLPSFAINGMSESDKIQVKWEGLSALLSMSPNVDKLDGTFTVYGLSSTANIHDSVNKGVFKLGKIINKLKLTHVQEGLWLEQAHFSLDSILLHEGDEKLVELEAFDFALDSNIKSGMLNFDWDLSLKKVQVEDKTYGPGAMKLSLKNIDPVAMANINKLEWDMIQNNQDPKLHLAALVAQVPKLLSKGAELELSTFTFNMPEGKITGTLKISLPKNDNSDLNQLMQQAKGEGQFKGSIEAVKALLVASIKNNLNKQVTTNNQEQSNVQDQDQSILAEPDTSAASTTTPSHTAPTATNNETQAQKQADALILNWVNKGLLKVEGTDYVVHFKLENQQVTVNGQAFNPEMLK